MLIKSCLLISEILTSQHPRGSPLAASNPADMMVKSGANAEAAKKNNAVQKPLFEYQRIKPK